MIKTDTQIHLSGDTYKIFDHLGQGAYGIVWKASRLSDGEIVALKTVQICSMQDRTPYTSPTLRRIIQVLEWEIEFLRGIGSEVAAQYNLLPLLDNGKYKNYPVMVLPLCEHNLNYIYEQRRDQVISGQGSFPFDGARLLQWIGQIANALEKLHDIKTEEGTFIHRDLKFTNILVKENNLWLCDFGTVKIVENALTTSLAGTPEWGAPEMLLPVEITDGPRYKLTPAADLYSLGLIIHALITGNFPVSQGELMRQINARGEPLPGAEKCFGTIGGLTGQERSILQRDIRLLFATGQTLVQQEFFALPDVEAIIEELTSLVVRLLRPMAEKRPTAQEVKKRAEHLQNYLFPSLSALGMKLTEEIALEESCTVAISAHGNGLPKHGRWLHVATGGEPVESPAFRECGEDTWKLELPPFTNEGEYDIQLFAFVNSQKIGTRKRLKVSATPEQLWRQKRYVEALLQCPDRKEWFDVIEKKARWMDLIEEKTKRSIRCRREYLQILETVRKVHRDHVDINHRYWSIRRQIEKEEKKNQKWWTLKRFWLFAVSILAMAAAILLYQQIRWYEHPGIVIGETNPDSGKGESGNQSQWVASEEEKNIRIGFLLKTAEDHLNEGRLTTPPVNNAHETYQKILTVDPENEKARQGLENIVDQYLTLAAESLNSGKVADAEKSAKEAKGILYKHESLLLNKDPDNRKGRNTLRNIIGQYADLSRAALESGEAVKAKEYQKEAQAVADDFNAFYAGDLLRQMDDHIKAGEEDISTGEKKLEMLLGLAEEHLKKRHLTTPVGNNAYEVYKEVLSIDPENARGKQGLMRIADLYLILAKSAVDRSVTEDAKKYVSRGLKILESHERLLALKERLEKEVPPLWKEFLTDMEFTWVPGGCYEMGRCEEDKRDIIMREIGEKNYEKYCSDESQRQKVCVDGFWMGKYEVTQGQWEKIMGNNPSSFRKEANYPVENVSWNEVKDFISRLNRKSVGNYRLPEESEWEYACRSGGKPEKYCGGNNLDEAGWSDEKGGKGSMPVGTKAPNGLGLYDMSGNVWEWCEDSVSRRALRGGSWMSYTSHCEAAARGCDHIGFRLIKPP
ncbi:SUMF1/EgtB/PvdO family nonheme iron enzyme [Desulfococcaceae bacterium HSG8]|nr:SUMF1/EgtB/PvdO family nonheme iron enzyme [Desulfococcaceae bacterium HSG8]